MENKVSSTFLGLDHELGMLQLLVEDITKWTDVEKDLLPKNTFEAVSSLQARVEIIRKQSSILEEERREYSALSKIGQVINSSLDLEVVLRIVMDTIIHLTHAERGFLMLQDDEGVLQLRTARNWEQKSLDHDETTFSSTIIHQVIESGQPVLTTNAQQDSRFGNQKSIVAYNLRSILCVPLKVKDQVNGVIYADNRIRSGLFSNKDLELLSSFADQAAIAVENARLYERTSRTLDEVRGLKGFLDEVFRSIASGVLTVDLQGTIQLSNLAAANILGISLEGFQGQKLESILPCFYEKVIPIIKRVISENTSILDVEFNRIKVPKGTIDLLLNISPLVDVNNHILGTTVVLNDQTIKHQLELKKDLFERMVAPSVIHRLESETLHLGGECQEITILFADLKGFTSFSDSSKPEYLVTILNRYLALAADEILGEEGTIDKFLGDAIMAWFNAPILQADHAIRAVRAARKIIQKSFVLNELIPPEQSMHFGVGIHSGPAVLGLVGTSKRMEFTAIGDSVNTAKRIQEIAGKDEILISKEIYSQIKNEFRAFPCSSPFVLKGKKDPLTLYLIDNQNDN